MARSRIRSFHIMTTLFLSAAIATCTIMINPNTESVAQTLLKNAIHKTGLQIKVPYELPKAFQQPLETKCPVCSKVFRNSTYLQFHVMSKHIPASSQTHQVLFAQSICIFTKCRLEVGMRLSEKSRMQLCLEFAKEHLYLPFEDSAQLESENSTKKMSSVMQELGAFDRFCTIMIDDEGETSKFTNNMSRPFNIFGYYVVLLVCIVAIGSYYGGLYDKLFLKSKSKRSKYQ